MGLVRPLAFLFLPAGTAPADLSAPWPLIILARIGLYIMSSSFTFAIQPLPIAFLISAMVFTFKLLPFSLPLNNPFPLSLSARSLSTLGN